jgi:hypothetical protein
MATTNRTIRIQVVIHSSLIVSRACHSTVCLNRQQSGGKALSLRGCEPWLG